MYSQYNILYYDDFENDKSTLSSNVACTVLKTQEKKTQKGTSYAIVKFSDLSSSFELFIFSDIFEINREQLVEGNSLMITLIKNYLDENKTQKKINVKKIISLKEVLNSSIEEVNIEINDIQELDKIKSLETKEGKTRVKVHVTSEDKTFTFLLKDRRNIDYKLINILKNNENIKIN